VYVATYGSTKVLQKYFRTFESTKVLSKVHVGLLYVYNIVCSCVLPEVLSLPTATTLYEGTCTAVHVRRITSTIPAILPEYFVRKYESTSEVRK
jgi:hypothetical protein